jgi:acetolactate synthase-1/2/3 large subunit
MSAIVGTREDNTFHMTVNEESRRTGGTAVVAALSKCGVRHIFGIPGTHNLEIYREIGRSSIQHVSVRHEQGAGYAADGYARSSGSPSVCLTTTGPGLTNSITAAATAYADSVPMLVVSPGMPRGLERADVGWLHEMKDQHAMAEAVFEASHRVRSADEAVQTILTAFAAWSVPGRHRPVHLEVPVDILEGGWDGWLPDLPAPPVPVADPAELDRAASILGGSGTAAILVGGGAVGAGRELRALAERIGAPVVTTIGAKGVLPEGHGPSLGASVRLPEAQQVLESADTLLIVGSEISPSDLWDHALTPRGTVIRIDIDPHQMHKNLRGDVVLLGDSGPVLQGLLDRLQGDGGYSVPNLDGLRTRIQEEAQADAGPLSQIQDALRAVCPDDVIVAGDSSQISYFGTAHFWPMPAPHRFIYPTGFATLGYALPAGIGAALGTGRPVLAMLGDGAFTFSCQELMTAAALHLPVVTVVVDNSGFGEIRDEMVARGIEPLGVDLPRPDPVALAKGFGLPGEVASGIDDLAERVDRAFRRGGPALIWLTLGGE